MELVILELLEHQVEGTPGTPFLGAKLLYERVCLSKFRFLNNDKVFVFVLSFKITAIVLFCAKERYAKCIYV